MEESDKEAKKFYKEVGKELDRIKKIENKGKEQEDKKSQLSRLENLPHKLKTKYKEDEFFNNQYRIKMLILAIAQCESAIMEIKCLDQHNREKLAVTSYELQELSRLFSKEITALEQTKTTIKNTPNWLQVGILLANGDIDLNNKTMNFTETARTIFGENFKNYRPYISESVNNTRPSDKNIFSNKKKMLEIIKHCKSRNIVIRKEFHDIYIQHE